MSKSQEIKLAEQLINLTEDHWFNPAIMARYMANQPYYTLDRLMELVSQVIKEVSLRHGNNDQDGVESEGTYLANELNEAILQIQEYKEFEFLKLPKTKAELFKSIPQSYRIQREYEEKEFDEINLINQAYTMNRRMPGQIDKHIQPKLSTGLSTSCGFFVCVGMRATFLLYDHEIQIPENYSSWAKFFIYEPLTKIPENATQYV